MVRFDAFARKLSKANEEPTDSSVSPVNDPSAVVTSAAYLLFYRRRSDGPLGGPRFAKIFEKFDNPDVESDAEGEPGRPDVMRTASMTTRAQAEYGSITTVTPLEGPGSDDDLPPYDSIGSGDTVRRSIEQDDAEIPGDYQPLSSGSLMAQSWSFAGLGGGQQNSRSPEGSDAAHIDSSSDGGRSSRDFYDADTDMASADLGAEDHVGVASAPGPGGPGIITVDASMSDAANETDEVTEIRLDERST